MPKPIEIKGGEKYGKLTLTGNVKSILVGKTRARYVECVCVCGNKKWINLNSIRRGKQKSCGCGIYTHGMTYTRLFNIFDKMKQRCLNQNNSHRRLYGGRGIKLLWDSFEDFYNDMGESYYEHVEKYGEFDTTIDRIDTFGDYCKENCRWATRKEQGNNLSSNRKVIYKGKEYNTLKSLCDEYGIGTTTMNQRINKYGWSIEKAVETPIQVHKKFNS